METIGSVIVGLGVLMMMFGVFLLFRNQWVYRTRGKHINAVSAYTLALIRAKAYSPELHDQCYDALMDYGRMMYRFWIWDVEKLVVDRALWDRIYSQDS